MPEILQWNTISDRFNEGLLLGNGASVAVHQAFNYVSLFEEATKRGHITPNVGEVFRSFGEHDFEVVLRKLWQAKLVNQALNIPAGRVEEAYTEVRTALIATVRDTHVTYNDARSHLTPIYNFLKQFQTVVSLNYDLIVYWAALLGNDALGVTWFKDCFQKNAFREDWEPMREPYGRARGSTLFFYPHGNLALVRTSIGSESKVYAREGDLLDSILDRWTTGQVVPLFVCEGTSEQKKLAINSSS